MRLGVKSSRQCVWPPSALREQSSVDRLLLQSCAQQQAFAYPVVGPVIQRPVAVDALWSRLHPPGPAGSWLLARMLE